MLFEEAEDWWDNSRQRMELACIQITWVVFRTGFLEMYFLEDLHGKKEVEFLELKPVNMKVVDYTVKFEELVKFCPYYNREHAEASKYMKFENKLHPEIKQGVRYQEIRSFPVLVNKFRIYDEYSKARSSYYKKLNDKKGKDQSWGKTYGNLADKGKKKASEGKKTNEVGAPSSVKCFKCDEHGH